MIKSEKQWLGMNQRTEEDTCFVDGAQAFILRVSSVFGLAPLKFQKHGNGYHVCISIPMCIYSYLIKTALVIQTLFVTISEMDLSSPFDHKTSSLSQVMSCCATIVFLILTSTGVYGSPVRMKKMIKCMSIISLVDKGIGVKYSQVRERRLKAVCLFIIACFSILIVDGIIYSVQMNNIVDYWNHVGHLGFTTVSFVAVVLELQFSITVMAVYSRIKQVNNALSITACSIEKSSFLHPLTSAREAVHRLAILHGKLLDVVELLEDSYGVCLLITLLSKMFHLINTPYFAIYGFYIRISGIAWYHFLAVETSWYIFHLLMLFMVVEPCHYTAEEGHRTEMLVRRMLSTSDELLAIRLEIFSRQLMLQPLAYRPLGFCTLDRPLIASMFGAVATYLVILVQFQKNDN